MKKLWILLLLPALAFATYIADPWIITDITATAVDYAMDGTETFVGCNTTDSSLIITLPPISGIQVGVIKQFQFGHAAGHNGVRLECAGADEFIYGNTYFELGSQMFRFTAAILRNGANSWGLARNVTVRALAHRNASWAASNFSSMTVIPWDDESYNNQDELLVYTAGASARYTVQTTGTYRLNYTIDIDSTGGGTWNATATVYKNGVAVDDTETRTGNYGSEDQSMSLPSTYIDLVAGDYLDLRIDQNNLTGNLVHSMFNIEIRL